MSLALPPKDVIIRKYCETMRSMYWVPDEIQYEGMNDDWKYLSKKEQVMLERILTFFAIGDELVLENLGNTFIPKLSELGIDFDYAYSMQKVQEQIHSETYAKLFYELISDEKQKQLIDLYSNKFPPGVQYLKDWIDTFLVKKEMDEEKFAKQLIVFIAIEGGIFNPLFAFIRSLSNVNGKSLFNGLTTANDFIARDEACHTQLGGEVYKRYFNILSENVIIDILKEACCACVALIIDSYELSNDFTKENLEKIIDDILYKKRTFQVEKNMNVSPENLIKYAAYVTDYLYRDILEKEGDLPYDIKNPLPFMDVQALNTTKSTDFFHKTVTSYQTPVMEKLKPIK